MKKKQKKVNFEEGSCFYIPLREGGFGRGLVARCDGKGTMFAYYFGPKLQEMVSCFDDLDSQNAVLVGFSGDLALIHGEWPIAGTFNKWKRDEWPLLPLYREDERAKKAWLSYFDEETLERVKEEPTELDQRSLYPYDRLMGYGAVEIRLTKLLSEIK